MFTPFEFNHVNDFGHDFSLSLITLKVLGKVMSLLNTVIHHTVFWRDSTPLSLSLRFLDRSLLSLSVTILGSSLSLSILTFRTDWDNRDKLDDCWD